MYLHEDCTFLVSCSHFHAALWLPLRDLTDIGLTAIAPYIELGKAAHYGLAELDITPKIPLPEHTNVFKRDKNTRTTKTCHAFFHPRPFRRSFWSRTIRKSPESAAFWPSDSARDRLCACNVVATNFPPSSDWLI